MRLFDLFNAIPGWTLCRVSGALPSAFLNRCAAFGVEPVSVEQEEEYALRVLLRSRDLAAARRAALDGQCALTVLSEGGAPRFRRTLLRRAAAVSVFLALLALLAWSRLYIWEIEVSGNETVPTARILDALREVGVEAGTFWPGITSDNLRSELLIELPELSWATVNIYGSRALVLVRERVPRPELWDPEAHIDITADKAGFVRSVRVLNGTARVRPGSSVLPGEILISGSADSAMRGTRAQHAAGYVVAETYYELSASLPLTELRKEYTGRERTRWALVLGKKYRNIFGNSSISGESCDRITSAWSPGLGGVFSLPVAVVRVTDREYRLTELPRDLNLARRELEESLRARLARRLGDGGTVEQLRFSTAESGGTLTVCLRARCTEQLGRETPAELSGNRG